MDFSSHYCWASVTFSLFHCLSVTSAHFLCQRVTLAQQLKMQSSRFLHTSMTHSDRWVLMGQLGMVDFIATFSDSREFHSWSEKKLLRSIFRVNYGEGKRREGCLLLALRLVSS